jgi:hypothetical protein
MSFVRSHLRHNESASRTSLVGYTANRTFRTPGSKLGIALHDPALCIVLGAQSAGISMPNSPLTFANQEPPLMATSERTSRTDGKSALEAGSRSQTDGQKQKPKMSAQEPQRAAASAAESVKDQGWELASRVKDEVKAYLGGRKEGVAAMLNDVAEATRKAAETLSDRKDASAARYATTAATQTKELSKYVRDHDPTDLINDLKRVARSNPAAVCGGLFVAGLVMSRFLRSSEPNAPSR